MHIEIERKFLVRDDSYKLRSVKAFRIRQGYIAHDGGRSVRVRIRDGQGFLTIKGPTLGLASRAEWEKEIPLRDAEDLFLLCKPGQVDKTRWIVPAEDSSRFFEVDEFLGENEGLVLAEIELGSEDESFVKPAWLGEEVTGDRRYFNAYLSRCPYKTWK